MKSEDQVKNDLIKTLRQQADLLEKGDLESIIAYRTRRTQIEVLEDVLELNVFNNVSMTHTDLFKDRKD